MRIALGASIMGQVQWSTRPDAAEIEVAVMDRFGVTNETRARLSTKLTRTEGRHTIKTGVEWTEKKGYTEDQDRKNIEEQGAFTAADPAAVSDRAKERGVVRGRLAVD